MQNRYLIILNKTANQGHTAKIWPDIKAALNVHHINYVVTSSKYHKNAILITEEYIKQANQNDVLLVIGGDGTLNEVVNGSEHITRTDPNLPKLPIGYIPTGKHNNFANNHHIPLNWRKALSSIINNRNNVHYVKIGYFDESIKNQRIFFLNNIGIGLNADLIDLLRHSKIGWKACRYFINIFEQLYNLQSFTLEIYHPHKTKIYPNVFLANISISKAHDHNFNLIIIERRNLMIMFYIFFKLLLNKPIKSKCVHTFKVNKLHIGIPTLEYGHADGENLGDRFYDAYYHVTKYPFI